MNDQEKLARAREVYDQIGRVLEKRNWHFSKREVQGQLIIDLEVNGDDIPLQMVLIVDPGRQMIKVWSPFLFKMSEDKRMDGAIAACVASYGLVDGSFDYDISNGKIMFRLTASFIGSTVSDAMIEYLVDISCSIVDAYNDKFFALEKGMLSISEFVEAFQ